MNRLRDQEIKKLHGEIIDIFQWLREEGREDQTASIWSLLNARHRVEARGRKVEPQDLVELIVWLWKIRPTTRWVLYFPDTGELGSQLYDDLSEATAAANDMDGMILRVEL